MAHKKVIADPRLLNWADVDETLRQIHEAKNSIAELDAEQNRRIDTVKDECSKIAQPFKNRIKQLESDLLCFTDAHRGELDGKSRNLTFGVVGYRLSSKLSIATSKLADAIALLKGMGLNDCINVTETLDKVALGKQPAHIIMEVGATISSKDTFFYDVAHTELTEDSI